MAGMWVVRLLVGFTLASPAEGDPADLRDPGELTDPVPDAPPVDPSAAPETEPQPEPGDEVKDPGELDASPAKDPGLAVPPPQPSPESQPGSTKPHAGKRRLEQQRYAGIGLLATGGALTVVGAVVAGVYFARSQGYTSDLRDANESLVGCPEEGQIPAMPTDPVLVQCRNNYAAADTARDNGRRANVGGYAGLGILGAGVVLGIIGSVVYGVAVRGERRSKSATIRPHGLGLQGRF